MGEKSDRFQFTFNGFLKVAFQGSRVTSDAGLVLVREFDERLGLETIIAAHLSDSRHGLNTQFPLPDLLRQSIYSRLAGYEDLNDAARLFDRSDHTVLDMDSSESPVHGQQEGSAYNGHFETVCYHPLFLFNHHGDCLAAKLRPGNVSSANDWEELLVPEIDRQQAEGQRVAFRADAAFARPAIYEALETRGVQYAIRIPTNKNLELAIEDLLFRPPGRPSRKPLIRYKSFHYQSDSWTTTRRMVAKVEHHVGELFPRVGFIVTNLPLPNQGVVRFYNKRGTAEQWIKEGKQAAHWTRQSCHRFRANEVRLQLSLLAYNLGNLWRRLVLPTRIDMWSLTSLQQRLVKTGGRPVARPVLLASAGREPPDTTPVRVDAPAEVGVVGPGGLAERWATRPKRARACSIAASAGVRLPVAPTAITGGVDEREVRPSHACEVFKMPPEGGSATVARDSATQRSRSWDSKIEIPAKGSIVSKNSRSVLRIISVGLAAFLLTSLAKFPYQVAAAPITMGETTVLPGTDSGNGNLLLTQSTALAQPGTVQSLSFYVRTAAGNLRLGIYDATGASGGPGALKAQTNSFAPVAGWNTQPVVTPASLPAGTYWLAYLPSSSSLTFAEGGGGQYKYANFTFGAMPAAYPAVAGSGTTHWSLYATLDTNTTPDTTPPTVTISAPSQGAAVSGTTAVNATASDDVTVVGVQFKLDGANLGAEDTASPYSVNWDTTITTNGSHTLMAIARDVAGNTATSTTVNVTVSNTPPAFPIYRASSTFTSGTGAITPPYPASMAAGDVCFLAVESENQAITLSSVQGFAEVPTFSPQSAGTAASNPASRFALFWKRTVGGDAAPTVADPGDHTTGQIHCFRNVVSSGTPWDTGAGGNDSVANDTSGTVPGATTSSSNTLVVLFTSTSFNGTNTAQCSAWTNAGLANLTERTDNTNTAGRGGGHCMATGEKASAGAYGATTLTLANTSFKGAISLALKSGQSVLDATPPSASMTAPAFGATVSGVVTVSADATDDIGVHDVEFLVDGVTVNDDTTAPYSFSWDTTTTSNGQHTLSARAHDGAGNFGLTSGVVTVTVNNQPSQLPPDLVAAWPFAEGTGLATADVTNYANTAMFESISEPIWAVGKYGNGVRFDGTSTSFLTVNDSPTMNVTGTALTISMWINPSSGQATDGVVIGKFWGGSGPHYQYGIELSSSRVPNFYIGTTNNSLLGAGMGSALPAGQWSHIAITYDGSIVRFYVNGALVSSPSMNGSIADRSGSVIRIGADVDGSQGFKGSLDDVRLYKRVENQTDIVTDMNTPLVGNSTGIPPSVAITSPTPNAQVSNIVTIVASSSEVVGVQFFVDGISIGVEDTAEPYAVNWDTRSFPNGAHFLNARARDAGGATTVSNPVTVNVANTDTFQNEILSTRFTFPIAVKFLPDGRMLVAELGGKIWINPAPYTTPDPTPFLTVPNIATGDIQMGIYDFALDPDFTTNRYVYVSYTSDIGRDRLSRFTIDQTYAGMVPGSELIIYQDPINLLSNEHHGGAIAFSNDGKIFFATGEHFQGTPSQDLRSPWGKVHRFNMNGSVPTDNPFYDGAGPHWDSVYALGLRNPFRAYYDAPTGRLLVADVGGNGSLSWEEVNLITSGANFGWPDCENGTCGNPAFTAAAYAYPHDTPGGSSITGGFVYQGSQFPTGMQGSYFFADYARNYIKRLTFDPNGNVNGVFNFEPPSGVTDGPYGDIVYLTEGPDGALYYLDLGYSDTSGTYGVSKLRRIRYQSANQAPSAVATADKTSGPTPLTVNFSSAGSSDPEGQPITYSWDFGDGSALSMAASPAHTFIASGIYTVRLTVFDGVNSTFSPPISVSVGSAPTGTIISPVDGATFRGGDVISFSGSATDPDDGVLSASAFTWNIDFLHDGHVHPGLVFNGVENGTFTIPATGHDFSGNTRYRFTLTVTDSNGLKHTRAVTIWPQKVNLTFDTVPSGITLYLDGVAKTTPFVYETLTNFQHSIEARNTIVDTTPYNFASWSDGGTQSHTIIVPVSAQGYVATYFVGTSVTSNFGETTILGGTDGGNGNLLLVQSATLAQPGTLQSLSFYVRTASGQLRLGIYDATGASGGPGTLLAQTNAFAPTTGWNTANVITPVSLPAGNYWLAYFPSSSSLTFALGGGGVYHYAAIAFGAMPTTFPVFNGSGTMHWSLYGTVAR